MKEGNRTVYRLRRKLSHHYAWYIIGGILLLLAGTGAAVYATMQPRTIITQSPAVVRYSPADEPVSVPVQESIFSFDLPAGWEMFSDSNAQPGTYSWRGTKTVPDQERRLDIYIDRPMRTLAVNRLLPVAAAGGSVQITGGVSDNCINFTSKTSDAVRTGQALSKWDGINFNCDMGNYERDVVAIGSADGFNAIALTGAANGKHQVLLVFTDNSTSPDYTVFQAIVASFKVS